MSREETLARKPKATPVISSAATNYPSLHLLLYGYFNQDWVLDYPDAAAVVHDFAASEPSASSLPVEVDRLLREHGADELSRILTTDPRFPYQPEEDGVTLDQWLRLLAERVLLELRAM